MKFGIFMAPFHRAGENPTLCFERDLELTPWSAAIQILRRPTDGHPRQVTYSILFRRNAQQ